jgi:triosephosphate isomerase
MRKVLSPTLSVNAKSYMWGEDLFKIAQHCEKVAVETGLTVEIQVNYCDIRKVKELCPHLVIFAQYCDDIDAGNMMGGITAGMLKEAGADGVVINHAGSRPITLHQMVNITRRAKEAGLKTNICVDNAIEAAMVAHLHPTCIVVEQNDKIGTDQIASEEYIAETIAAIRAIDKDVLIAQGAGIRTGADCYRNIKLGAFGGGGASGIFKSEDPIATIDEYVQNGILKAREDFGVKELYTLDD